MARIYHLQPGRPTRLTIDYERDLNPEQQAVVEAGDGPKLVIAGAGSGKTRTLTYRVGRLLDRGVAPEQILLLTFTNKAAREMLNRVGDLVGIDARRVCGGTFHHVGNLLLRDHCEQLGYGGNYSIIDREDAREVMAAAVAAAGIDHRARRFPKPEVLIDIVSTAINTQQGIADVVARKTPYFLSLSDGILEVARRYVDRKRAMNVMDFDDLLLNWWLALEEIPEVAKRWQGRFRNVLVDEYQDTNSLQGLIIDRMAAEHRNITVVGDDCQSIYSFRGADFENILRFPQRYDDAEVFHLTVNYRSSPEILELANQSIVNNVHRFDKQLRAVRPPGPKPAVIACRDVYQQADFIAQRILDLRDEGVNLEQVAVLYRAHNHAMEIQVELTRRGIPFRVRSGLRFFEQAHIKDVLSYLRFIYNPLDELGFKRAVKLHEGVGNKTAADVFEAVRAAHDAGEEVRRADALRRLARRATARARRRQFANADQRIEDIDQLADYADAFEGLEAFLTELALVSSFGAEDVVGADEEDERVTLSSVHQAKGLEWGRVFVAWLCDGRFPVGMALKEPGGEEEERRLFYVAVTRAQEELYLTYPMVHRARDHSQILLERSRFLVELPAPSGEDEDDLYETWSLQESAAEALPESAGAAVLSFPPPAEPGE